MLTNPPQQESRVVTAVLFSLITGSSFGQSQPCAIGWQGGDSLPGIAGPVRVVAEWDPDGPGIQEPVLVAGGLFTIAGDQTVRHIALWNGGTWESVGSGVNGAVEALAVYEGELIAAGTFSEAGGFPAARIAAWDGKRWRALAEQISTRGSILAMTLFEGRLIAAGGFSSLEGVPANNAAAWDGNSWQPVGANLGSQVFALAVWNRLLVAGGRFTTGDAQNIAAWDGISWKPVGTGLSNEVDALLVYKGSLYAAGMFTSAGSTPVNYIARWDGSSWNSVGGGTDMTVKWLSEFDERLIAAGAFTKAGGLFALRLAAWDGENWQPIANGLGPEALGVYRDRLIVAGTFEHAGKLDAIGVAAWDGTSFAPLERGSGLGREPAVLHVHNGDLIAGGYFNSAGGRSVGHVARWDGTAWYGLDIGTNDIVLALETYNGQLIAGGLFTMAGGQPANHIALWDGATWHTLGAGVNGMVTCLKEYEGQLFVGGTFTSAGGVNAKNIARWNGATWSGQGLNDTILAMCIHQDQLYIAGGSFMHGVARWAPTGFEFPGGGVPGPVWTLASYQGELIANGHLAWNGSAWRDIEAPSNAISTVVHDGLLFSVSGNTLGVWDGIAWTTSYNPGIRPMVSHDQHLVVGGNLNKIEGEIAAFLARWGPTGPTITQQPLSQRALLGETVTFTTQATEVQHASSQWRKDGLPIDDNDRFHGTKTFTLTVTAVELSDRGSYDVLITDSCGATRSNVAFLKIVCSAPGADFNQDCYVDEDDLELFVLCTAGAGLPYASTCPLLPDDQERVSADFDHDGDVDISDFGVFQRCLSGVTIQADPACAN